MKRLFLLFFIVFLLLTGCGRKGENQTSTEVVNSPSANLSEPNLIEINDLDEAKKVTAGAAADAAKAVNELNNIPENNDDLPI
jgi:hypothetical protein